MRVITPRRLRRSRNPNWIDDNSVENASAKSDLSIIALLDWLKSSDSTGFFLDYYAVNCNLRQYALEKNISYEAAKKRLQRARKQFKWEDIQELMS